MSLHSHVFWTGRIHLLYWKKHVTWLKFADNRRIQCISLLDRLRCVQHGAWVTTIHGPCLNPQVYINNSTLAGRQCRSTVLEAMPQILFTRLAGTKVLLLKGVLPSLTM